MVQRILITLGIVLLVLGLIWPWLQKMGLGKLPGDIVIQKDNFRLYFPITTSIIISLVLTLLFWIFRR